MDSEPKSRIEGMAGLEKGLAIIEAFRETSQLSIADAARAAGVTRAAARRCLLTLVRLGYVVSERRQYRPSARLHSLGSSAKLPLPVAAQPFLDKLRDSLNESVSLAISERGNVLFVARANADRIVSTGIRVGGRAPMHCTATGRVLLSALPDAKIRKLLSATSLEALTPKTPISVDANLAVIRKVRRDGYALNDEELEIGLIALAVPVRNSAGDTVAAISVSALATRLGAKEMISEYAPALRQCATDLGRFA